MGLLSWYWASASNEALETIDEEMRDACNWTLARSPFDLMAREGRRDRETQERYFRAGLTRARWGQSAHNAEPPVLARAIHLIPLPLARNADGSIDWSDRRWLDRCAYTAGLMRAAGLVIDVEIVWGGFWRSIYDPCHYERGTNDRNGR